MARLCQSSGLRRIERLGQRAGEPTFHIDDQELSLRDFGRLLVTYAGWGMRVVFVPDDEVHESPRIEVRQPEEEEPPT